MRADRHGPWSPPYIRTDLIESCLPAAFLAAALENHEDAQALEDASRTCREAGNADEVRLSIAWHWSARASRSDPIPALLSALISVSCLGVQSGQIKRDTSAIAAVTIRGASKSLSENHLVDAFYCVGVAAALCSVRVAQDEQLIEKFVKVC